MQTSELSYNVDGLIPVVCQDVHTREVLMLAWMNQAAIDLTLSSGDVTYWSRSRQELWRKGGTSGNVQRLVSMKFDCDADALLIEVEQVGSACHTGSVSCFDAGKL
jgi:phosphoribosyl-AMP cyclohydrolase/phosphoribosyl-ATP pyrophosphohydrolase/phosphoribosyl-AMP cyclohydrolase